MPVSTISWREERHAKLKKAKEFLDKAETEKRSLNDTERTNYSELISAADILRGKIDDAEKRNDLEREFELNRLSQEDERGGERRFTSKHFKKPQLGGLRFRDEKGTEIRAIPHGESYGAELGIRGDSASVGKLIYGAISGDWSGATEERAFYQTGASASGGFMLNPEMSAQIIDLARAQSVILAAGALTVPMQTETLKLAKIETDPTAYWVREGQEITESEGTFGSIELRARALAVYCEASLPLMRDAANASQIIESTITKAIALALDEAALNGDGTAEKPIGMLYSPAVQNYAVGGTFSYSNLVEAKRRAWRYNVEPGALIYNHALRAYIATMFDGEGLPIVGRIPEYDSLNRQMSTQVSSTANTCAYVGDFSNVLIGIRNTIEIEASGVAGTVFQRAKVAIRGYMRCDVGFARNNDVVKMSGITGCTST